MAEEEIVYIWWPFGIIVPLLLVFVVVGCVFMTPTVYKSVTRNPDGSITTTTRSGYREKNTPIVLQARANRII